MTSSSLIAQSRPSVEHIVVPMEIADRVVGNRVVGIGDLSELFMVRTMVSEELGYD